MPAVSEGFYKTTGPILKVFCNKRPEVEILIKILTILPLLKRGNSFGTNENKTQIFNEPTPRKTERQTPHYSVYNSTSDGNDQSNA